MAQAKCLKCGKSFEGELGLRMHRMRAHEHKGGRPKGTTIVTRSHSDRVAERLAVACDHAWAAMPLTDKLELLKSAIKS